MAGGTYGKVKTVVAGETILAVDRNDEHDNHIANNSPQGVGGHSDDLTTMRATTDPYPGEVPNLATTLEGEIERLRFQVSLLIDKTYWYQTPSAGGGGPS